MNKFNIVEVVNRRYYHPRNIIAAFTEQTTRIFDLGVGFPEGEDFDPSGDVDEDIQYAVPPEPNLILPSGCSWEFPVDILMLGRIKRNDTTDLFVDIHLGPELTEVTGDPDTGGVTLWMDGGDATHTLNADAVTGENFDSGVGFSSANDVQFWMRLNVDTDMTRVRVWASGSSEPGSWTAEAAGTVYQNLKYLHVQPSLGDTSPTYFEIFQLTVDGFNAASHTDTFSRVVSGSWGTSEILSLDWGLIEGDNGTPVSNFIQVDGDKARFFEPAPGVYNGSDLYLDFCLAPTLDEFEECDLIEEQLTEVAGAYFTSLPFNFFRNVWYDGLLANYIEHYTLSGNDRLIPNVELLAGTEVIAQYVVGTE